MKHTPGPWYSVKTLRGEYLIVDEKRKPLDRMICVTGTAFKHDEKNAHLIAAAPELLEALETIIAYGACDENLDAARAAIKKATGE